MVYSKLVKLSFGARKLVLYIEVYYIVFSEVPLYRFFFNVHTSGTSAAGVTVRLEPIARQRSALPAWSKLLSKTAVNGDEGILL